MGGEQAFWNSARINGQPGGNNPKALKLRALRRLFGTVGRKANCRADIFPSAASTAYFRLSFEASDLRAKGPVFVCGAPRNREGEISLSQRLSLSPPGREKYLRIYVVFFATGAGEIFSPPVRHRRGGYTYLLPVFFVGLFSSSVRPRRAAILPRKSGLNWPSVGMRPNAGRPRRDGRSRTGRRIG